MSQPPYPPAPPPPPYPPGGPPDRGRASGEPWQAFLAALLGIVVFVVANTVLALTTIGVAGAARGGGATAVLIVAAVLLAVALTGVPLIIRGTSYFVKGLGIGLLAGWALASIVSAGFCTGLNPGLYATMLL